MNRSADSEVVLHLIATADGGKERSILSGYRPNYAIRNDYLTSTNHELIDASELAPGTEGRANVWFITPEVYPHSLWPGREITVSEGSRVVGTAIVIHVFNPILAAENG
jgi:translation elongation factor EF-Tu-like GTPase